MIGQHKTSGGFAPALQSVCSTQVVTALAAVIILALPGISAGAASVAPCSVYDNCLPVVVVTATREARSSFDLPLAIDVIDSDRLRDQHLGVSLSETMNRVPGMTVQNRETYAQEQQVTLRGFGARSQFGVRGIKVLVDGIPANTPDGQGSTGLFDLSAARAVEVMRGGFSSLYGNHSGGVIQVFSEDGPAAPTLTSSFAAGSFGTWRVGATFGGTSGAINYIGSASRFETAGYRDWSWAQKDQSNVKLKWETGQGTTFILVGNYLNQPNSRDPLGLTALQMASDPRQSSAAARQFETRRSLENRQGGLLVDHVISSTDTLRVQLYNGQRSNEQYLAIPLAAQNATSSSGGVSAFDRDFYGIGLRWSHARDDTRLTMGADYEVAKDDRKGWVNNNGAKGALKRNETDKVRQSGAYFQSEQSLAKDWIMSGGLRYTRVDFDSRDHFTCITIGRICSGSSQTVTAVTLNPDDSGSVAYSAWTGALGLVYQFSPQINFYANAGRSFETPTFTEIAYQSGNQTGVNLSLKDSRSNQYEVGFKLYPRTGMRANAALFHIDTSNEIVVATSIGGRNSYRNAGKTERQGVEISIDTALNQRLSAYFAATWLDAVFADGFTGSSGNVASGNRLPGVSRTTAYGELVWRNVGGSFTTALEARFSGNSMVNDINSESAAAFVTANWRMGFNQTINAWQFSEFLRIDNLFNRKYVGSIYVNDANGRFYAPAPGRSYLAGVNVVLRY